MKTTIDIDDALLGEIVEHAATCGKTLDELLDQALRRELLVNRTWARDEIYPGPEEILGQIEDAMRAYEERKRNGRD